MAIERCRLREQNRNKLYLVLCLCVLINAYLYVRGGLEKYEFRWEIPSAGSLPQIVDPGTLNNSEQEWVYQNHCTASRESFNGFLSQTPMSCPGQYSLRLDNGSTLYGQAFNPDLDYMNKLELDRIKIVESHDDLERLHQDNLTFVMACSRNHFEESLDAVGSVQKYFPNNKIVYFDWNLKKSQRVTVDTWCNVERRVFNQKQFPLYNKYSNKVARYQTLKILMVAMALEDNPFVMWLDASVRFLTSDLGPVLDLAKQNGGLVFFSHMYHSTFAATHPGTYAYLATDTNLQKLPIHVETTVFLVCNSREIFSHVIWWWILCALQVECIAPIQNNNCSLYQTLNKDILLNQYSGCHRMDQSVANILVSNYFDFQEGKFRFTQGKDIIKIERYESEGFKVKTCR